MKRIFLTILSLLVFLSGVSGQDNQNYVKTTERHTNGNTLVTYGYYDEGGRPCGAAGIGVTPNHKNLLSQTEYDGLGRESRQWLPLPANVAYMDAASMKQAVQSHYADNRPYTEHGYEASPLNRILSETGVGNAWAAHPQRRDYQHNTNSFPLSCKDYHATYSGQLVSNGQYAPHTLDVTVLTDEDGRCCYEFRNAQNRVVLKRSMLDDDSSADTYFVYDGRGDLRFVLQPGYQDVQDLDKFAFQYSYDARHNVISKKLPGSDPVRYAYDKANRLAYSQDGRQHSEGHMTFMLYDRHDRLLVKGICNGTDLPSTGSLYANATPAFTTAGCAGSGYSAATAPANATLSEAHYYDDYQCLQAAGFSGAGFTAGACSAKGLETATKTAVLQQGSTPLYSVSHYDIKGRVVLRKSTNHLGGTESVTTEYGYLLPQRVVKVHTAPGKAPLTQEYNYTYDHADRLLTTTCRINSGSTVTLQSNTYDETGRLKNRTLGNTITVGHTYNVRSWLKKMSSPLFSEELYYNDTYSGSTPQYGGNISAMTWKTDGKLHGYRFYYDELSRLTSADYTEGGSANGHYDEMFQYDRTGNVLSIVRNGLLDDKRYGCIDDLSYSYNGNQVIKVTDDADGPSYQGAFHFVDGSSASAEYAYDLNGNMTKDLNKGISSIQYNVQNLPESITYSGGRSAAYLYDATGRKLRVSYRLYASAPAVPTDYCDNIVYENGQVRQVLFDDGYVTFSGTTPVYHYYLKDHLGNNRVVVSAGGVAEQVNHYYAFGGLMGESTGGDIQRYKYNGKELDRMHGLDWYDYGARMMDAARGVFTTMDPFCENKPWLSPYVYGQNNPLRYVDPDGKDDLDKVKGFIYGIITNVISDVGNIRDSYTPNNYDDYNAALKSADKISTVIGTTLLLDGGKNVATGLEGASASAVVTLASGGAATPVTIVSGTGGLAIAATGAAEVGVGAMILANSSNNSSKGYNRGKKGTPKDAYNEYLKGKAPKEIERIDKPKAGQIHVHQKGKGATNADGTIHDKGRGAPEWSNKVVKWLRNYGFNI